MSTIQASEFFVKHPSEVRFFYANFTRKLAPSETISSISSVVVAPAGSLTVDSSAVEPVRAKIVFSGGKPQATFSAASSTDLFTATAHGLVDGDPVRLISDEDEDMPGGILEADGTDDSLYYVRDGTSNTFALSISSGGDAVDLTSDGKGIFFVEYQVTATVVTSESQTLIGTGRVQIRT